MLFCYILEYKSENCNSETFELMPSGGELEAYITHVSNSKTLIQVFFTAKWVLSVV